MVLCNLYNIIVVLCHLKSICILEHSCQLSALGYSLTSILCWTYSSRRKFRSYPYCRPSKAYITFVFLSGSVDLKHIKFEICAHETAYFFLADFKSRFLWNMFIFIMMTLFYLLRNKAILTNNTIWWTKETPPLKEPSQQQLTPAAVFHRNLTGKFFIIAGSAPSLILGSQKWNLL